MKKNILFAVLAVAMLSFVSCRCKSSLVCEYPNVVVTGILVRTGLPAYCPPSMDCVVPAVWAVVNDTGTFILLEDGQPIFAGAVGFRNFSEGDRISICGSFVRGEEDYNKNYYFLTVSRVIR